jgi:hypothetical protein
MIWCCGMYASGSTWLYNATRAAGVAAGVPVEARYVETYRAVQGLRRSEVTYVVKSHALEPRASRMMGQRASKILLTIRDPRDCIVSIMEHMGLGFEAAFVMVTETAAYVAARARDPRALLLRYESGFIDDPATFDILAGVFDKTVDEATRARLFAATRRAVIEAKIAKLEALATTVTDYRTGDVVDLDTQWHRHHAHRTGEVGRWRRRLLPRHVRALESALGGMAGFGYEEV